MTERHSLDTNLGRKTPGELIHVLVPKQLPDVGANGVNAPDHAGAVRGNSLGVLHPNAIFTFYVVSLSVTDRLAN